LLDSLLTRDITRHVTTMATHSYSLQWGDHQTMLTSAVQNCSPDVTLVCGDVHLPASRLVLSASSTLLYSLLKEAPSSPIIISLPDTNHDQLHSLLTFLQTGQIKANKEHLVQVLETADYLQMTCFSGQKTESGKQIFSAISRNTDSVFREVLPKKEESLNMPDEKTVDIINEEEYLKLRRRMVDTSLKKVFEQDGRTSLKCDICGKKWVGNVSKDRRRAVRHMGLHLQVRVRCSLCGVSLKSAESFYLHKTKSCKNKSESQVDVAKERKEGNGKVGDKEVKDDKWNLHPKFDKPDDRVSVSIGGTLMDDDKVQKLEEDMAKVNNDWYCLICGKFWHVKAMCKRHVLTHFPCKLPCVVCGKMLSSKYMLQKHENSCHEESSSESVIENKSEMNSIENGQTKTNSDETENAEQSKMEGSIDLDNNYYGLKEM